MYNSMGFGMGFGWLYWIAIIGLAIYLILKINNQNNKLNSTKDSPLDILKKRYAKGEISEKEFKEMKNNLS